MNKFRSLVAASLSISLAAMPGCSAFVQHTQRVVITPSVPEAVVSVDGEVVGTGRQDMRLRRDERHRVTAEFEGRQGAEAINKKISATGILDIVGGCFFLVPFIGVITPGFWELEPTEVNVIIPEAPAHKEAPACGPSTRSGADHVSRDGFIPQDLSWWVGKRFEDLQAVLNDPENRVTLLQKTGPAESRTYTFRQGSDRSFTVTVAEGKVVSYTK